eukprot:236864-Prorocentrum_minimum.AAC.1
MAGRPLARRSTRGGVPAPPGDCHGGLSPHDLDKMAETLKNCSFRGDNLAPRDCKYLPLNHQQLTCFYMSFPWGPISKTSCYNRVFSAQCVDPFWRKKSRFLP